MERIEVENQRELDGVLDRPDVIPICVGDGTFEAHVTGILRAVDQARVRATGTGLVEATGNASVDAGGDLVIEAYHGSTVHARGSVTVMAMHRVNVIVAEHSRVLGWGEAAVEALDDASVDILGRGRLVAAGRARVRVNGMARVEARDSVQVAAGHTATVEAHDRVHVRARGRVRVRAGDAAVVECFELARVVAADSVQVDAWGAAVVRILGDASVRPADGVTVVTSGTDDPEQLRPPARPPRFAAAPEWCEFYGVPVRDGVAELYKAVRDDYRSRRGILYAPGSSPEAPDWDGGNEECGGGLHFSARPFMAFEHDHGASRIMACPVRVDGVGVPAPSVSGGKLKAPCVCGPVYEVDESGNPVQ